MNLNDYLSQIKEIENLPQSEIVKNMSSMFGENKSFEVVRILLEVLRVNEVKKQLNSFEKVNLSDEVQRFETELIRNALTITQGCQVKAAGLLGLKATTLNRKIKRYKIDHKSFSSI